MLSAIACLCLLPPPDLTTKPVTLRLANTSYGELCQALSDQLGAQFKVAGTISDRKITVFCKERPFSELAKASEQTLGVEWKRTDKGYELTLSASRAKAEERQSRSDDNAIGLALRSRIAYISWYLSQRPEDRENMANNPQAKQPDFGLTAAVRQKLIYGQTFLVPLVAAMGDEVESALSDLLSGQVFAFSSSAGDRLPVFVPQKELAVDPSGPPQRLVLEFQYGLRLLRVWYSLAVADELQTCLWAREIELGGTVGEGPLQAECKAWEDDKAALALSDDTSEVERAQPTSPYLADAFSLAEHFEYLHDRTGRSFLAEGFRLPVSGPRLCGAATLGGYLTALSKVNQSYRAYSRLAGFRLVDNWVCAHHDRWWELQTREVPQRLLEPIEKAYAARRTVSVDEYAQFVGGLTPQQETSFESDVAYLTKFPKVPIRGNCSLLRLWAMLSDPQKRSAATGGLCFTALSAQQKQLFETAVQSVLLCGHWNAATFPAVWRADAGFVKRLVLSYGETPSDPNSLRPDGEPLIDLLGGGRSHPSVDPTAVDLASLQQGVVRGGAEATWTFGIGDEPLLRATLRMRPPE
jgi:hypothetical protein